MKERVIALGFFDGVHLGHGDTRSRVGRGGGPPGLHPRGVHL